MKKQGSSSPKVSGEERIHDSTAIFKRFLDGIKKPSVINTDAVKDANKVVATESKAVASELFNQIFGIELKAGKSVNLSDKANEFAKKEKAEKPELTAEHLQYFAEFKKSTEGQKTDEASVAIRQQLDAILAELRNLKESSDELENVFKDVVIDAAPEKPGIYHLTFYEGFLKLVLKMKDKVQDGVVYAKLFRSRKQERSYHSMAKKGGTSYTLHHDRAVATQTG